MKVVLLESGRGNRAPVIAGWREKIGLRPEDSITLLSWYPPREALPVDLHVVFGPKLRLRTKARSGAVLLDEIRRIRIAEEQRRREEGLDLDDAYDEDDAAQDEDDLAEQLPESMLGTAGKAAAREPGAQARPAEPDTEPPSEAAAAARAEASETIEEIIESAAEASPAVDEPRASELPAVAAPAPAKVTTNDVLNLPMHHPDRIKAALRWRARKVYYTAKGSYPVRKGRAGVRRAIGGIPSEFAFALAGWKGAPVVVGNADLVLSLDSRSQKAAWVLARRVHGPAVVVSYPAATRVLHQRRAEDAEADGSGA